MFECSFSFTKSSPASSQSICASIAAATCGHGFVERKIRPYSPDFVDWFNPWSNIVAHRDATPIWYWILMGRAWKGIGSEKAAAAKDAEGPSAMLRCLGATTQISQQRGMNKK